MPYSTAGQLIARENLDVRPKLRSRNVLDRLLNSRRETGGGGCAGTGQQQPEECNGDDTWQHH